MVAAAPITKEGKRIEAAIGKSLEKLNKANSDAYWARFQEEFAKQEKSNKDHHQQISNSASNGHKEFLAASEKMLKKEMAAVVPVVGRSVIPIIEKAVSAAVSEAFQVTTSSIKELHYYNPFISVYLFLSKVISMPSDRFVI